MVKIDTKKYPSIDDKYKKEPLPTFIIFKDKKPYDWICISLARVESNCMPINVFAYESNQ